MHELNDGFFNFAFTQTSDMHISKLPNQSSKLVVKYSVFAFFKQEVGLMKVRDILLTYHGGFVKERDRICI